MDEHVSTYLFPTCRHTAAANKRQGHKEQGGGTTTCTAAHPHKQDYAVTERAGCVEKKHLDREWP